MILVASPAVADTVELSILTDIPGATVYVNGLAVQRLSPVMVKFTMPKDFHKGKTGCITTAGVTARWASGAEASLPGGLSLCPANGKKQVITFNRPTGIEGREIDAQFALQVQQNRIANQQQALALYAAIQQLRKPIAVPVPPPIGTVCQPVRQPISCYSRLVAGTVYTECR